MYHTNRFIFQEDMVSLSDGSRKLLNNCDFGSIGIVLYVKYCIVVEYA